MLVLCVMYMFVFFHELGHALACVAMNLNITQFNVSLFSGSVYYTITSYISNTNLSLIYLMGSVVGCIFSASSIITFHKFRLTTCAGYVYLIANALNMIVPNTLDMRAYIILAPVVLVQSIFIIVIVITTIVFLVHTCVLINKKYP